jgi:hypothetical protein
MAEVIQETEPDFFNYAVKILYSTIDFGVQELHFYHDQLTNALKKHGDEVLVMKINKINKNGWSSNL